MKKQVIYSDLLLGVTKHLLQHVAKHTSQGNRGFGDIMMLASFCEQAGHTLVVGGDSVCKDFVLMGGRIPKTSSADPDSSSLKRPSHKSRIQ